MELDDFKSSWQALNQKLDQQTELNLHLLQESHGEKARHGLRPLMWGQAIQMALGTLLVLASGDFWWNHRTVPHLLVTGLLMHFYGLATILFGARMQVLMRRIDFGSPVLGIQKNLAELRRFYVLSGMWIGLPWWFLWIPFLVMLLMGFGVDLYLIAPSVVISLTAAGVVGFILTLFFIRWAKSRTNLAHTLEDAAAGSSLNNTQRLLDEIARFEHE